jgi:hypothetical protein
MEWREGVVTGEPLVRGGVAIGEAARRLGVARGAVTRGGVSSGESRPDHGDGGALVRVGVEGLKLGLPVKPGEKVVRVGVPGAGEGEGDVTNVVIFGVSTVASLSTERSDSGMSIDRSPKSKLGIRGLSSRSSRGRRGGVRGSSSSRSSAGLLSTSISNWDSSNEGDSSCGA